MIRKSFAMALFLVGFAATLCFAGTVDVTRARPRSGIDIRVTELMIQAMRARDAGDMNSAELFWIQARAYRPSLRRPTWLDQAPEQREDFVPLPQEVLLSRIASMPYHLAKPLLEARLTQEPGNVAVRQTYLQMAEANSDHAEISRHRSILHKESFNLKKFFKYSLMLFLTAVLLWQVLKLYRDLRVS